VSVRGREKKDYCIIGANLPLLGLILEKKAKIGPLGLNELDSFLQYIILNENLVYLVSYGKGIVEDIILTADEDSEINGNYIYDNYNKSLKNILSVSNIINDSVKWADKQGIQIDKEEIEWTFLGEREEPFGRNGHAFDWAFDPEIISKTPLPSLKKIIANNLDITFTKIIKNQWSLPISKLLRYGISTSWLKWEAFLNCKIEYGIQLAFQYLELENKINISRQMLMEIAKKHQLDIEELLGRSEVIYIPPLSSILFDRCERLEQIPEVIIKMRDEYSFLRKKIANWEKEEKKVSTLEELLKVRIERRITLKKLSEKLEKKYKPQTSIIRTVWGYINKLDPSAPLASTLFISIKHLLNDLLEWDSNRKFVSKINGFIDIYDSAMKINSVRYKKSLNRLFGEKNINYKAFKDWKYVELLSNNLHFNREKRKF